MVNISVAEIIEEGRCLARAKASMPHGAFLPWVQETRGYKPAKAAILMKIAAATRLTAPDIHQRLPPRWRTLYELAKLSGEAFDSLLASGIVHPAMTRDDLARTLGRSNVVKSPAKRGPRVGRGQRARGYMTKSGRYKITLRVPVDLYDWIAREATAEGTTVAKMAVRLLELGCRLAAAEEEQPSESKPWLPRVDIDAEQRAMRGVNFAASKRSAHRMSGRAA